MASWAGSSGPRAAAGGAAAELRLVSLPVRRSRAGGGLWAPPAAGAGVPLARLRCSLRAWALIPEKQPCGVSRASLQFRAQDTGATHAGHCSVQRASGSRRTLPTDRILEGWAPWGPPPGARQPSHLEPQTPHRSPTVPCSGSLRDAKPDPSPGPPWPRVRALVRREPLIRPHLTGGSRRLAGAPQPTTRNTAVPSWAASNTAGQRYGVPTCAHSLTPGKPWTDLCGWEALSHTRATLKLGSHP